jgi:ATP-dependent Clp protease ATP-binding subunit ClpA
VTERVLPDKAIDLIDESSSRVRMYKSPAAKHAKDLFGQLRSARQNRTLAQEEGNPDEVKEWEERTLDLEGQIERLRSAWDRANSPVVSAEDIAEVVSMWTGVPLMQLAEEESQRLLKMEEELHRSIIGQEDAIVAISRAVRRARAGLKDPKRPIGSFMFLGPTGVGKTELTKALAKFMFGSEEALIQLDMSEFMERHTASRLVGAPPGYIGYDDAGQLTEALRRRPYSIVVFDEVEKAHPELHNMLLQIMEEGRLTDNVGRQVDFKNTIIIMTSNIGSHRIQENLEHATEKNREEVYDRTREQVFELLKKTLRPEFLNRIDEIIMFRPLTKDEIQKVVELQIGVLQRMLEKNDIRFRATRKAVQLIAAMGFDPQFGARPIKRVLQKNLVNELSKMILEGNVNKDKEIVADEKDGTLVFRNS